MKNKAATNTFTHSNSTGFLFKSLKRLYIYAQIFGCASFSFSNGRVYVTVLNFISLIFFAVLYLTLSYLNFISPKTVDATGYQAILFFIGENFLPSFATFFMWSILFIIFLSRKKITQIMMDLVILDNEVSEANQKC